jgi:hypothetical protein
MKYSTPLQTISDRMKERIGSLDNMALKNMYVLTSNIAKKTAAIEKLALSRSPMETKEKHMVRLAEESQNLKKASTKLVNQCGDSYNSGKATITMLMNERCKLSQPLSAQEIRSTFRNLSMEEKTKLLSSAIERGDSELISSVCLSNPFLSGLTEDMQQKYLMSYKAKVAPELVYQDKLLDEMMESVLAAADTASRAGDTGFDPDELQKIMEAEKKYQEAMSELDG